MTKCTIRVVLVNFKSMFGLELTIELEEPPLWIRKFLRPATVFGIWKMLPG